MHSTNEVFLVLGNASPAELQWAPPARHAADGDDPRVAALGSLGPTREGRRRAAYEGLNSPSSWCGPYHSSWRKGAAVSVCNGSALGLSRIGGLFLWLPGPAATLLLLLPPLLLAFSAQGRPGAPLRGRLLGRACGQMGNPPWPHPRPVGAASGPVE